MKNVRLALADGQHVNYPDVVVSCDPADDDQRTVYAPLLIVEVLSKSPEACDWAGAENLNITKHCPLCKSMH